MACPLSTLFVRRGGKSLQLSFGEARGFYNWLGGWQDLQTFYEKSPVNMLLAKGDFAHARQVFELGFGTGRVAAQVLRGAEGGQARYLGVDISQTMVNLARQKLTPWGERARVELIGQRQILPAGDNSCDRFLATFVFDLLDDEDTAWALREAHRILAPGGLFCVTNLTAGATRFARFVTGIWEGLYALSPRLFGGCRPIQLAGRLSGPEWQVVSEDVWTRYGLSSSVLVARRCG
jgi:SAM-dependent methyltransferase